MNPLRIALLVSLAVVAGALLQWAAVGIYGYVALVLATQHVVNEPGSVRHTMVLVAAFALPALVAGATASLAMRRHQVPFASLVGLSAALIFVAQVAAPGFLSSGLSWGPAPLALLLGAVVGVMAVRRVQRGA